MNDLFSEDLEGRQEPGGSVDTARSETRRGERRRRRRRRTAFSLALTIVLFGVLVLAAVLGVRAIIDAFREEPAPDFTGPGSGTVTIQILADQTGTEIGATLAEAGVVASQAAFVEAYNANSAATSIQPGSYDLLLEMRAADAVVALLNPANRAEVSLTIVEGARATQIFERITSVTGIPLADVVAAATDTAAIGLPAEAGGNVEGWLAAATYTIDRDATATEVLAQMVAKTVAVLDQLAVPVELRQTVLIKASIVEKEVNNPDDYGKVARVIENRLLPGSETAGLLGMDSTLAYGLGKSGLELTISDLTSDHPYNTRVHPGLPPGPIGSPGQAAIEAVLAPPEGDWLYFVTVNLDTGETRFTASYEEHLANQQLLRDWTAQQTEGATE